MKLSTIDKTVTVVKPPAASRKNSGVTIFLAGSIDMGDAEDWQDEFAKKIKDKTESKITIFNPRRDDWDKSWKQTIDDENFLRQVQWEFDYLTKSDIIFMYFGKDSKSPISLLELGLFARSHKLIVVCPNGFYRKGNVEFICNTFDIPLLETMDDGVEELLNRIKRR